jgi:hypothetical protein
MGVFLDALTLARLQVPASTGLWVVGTSYTKFVVKKKEDQ